MRARAFDSLRRREQREFRAAWGLAAALLASIAFGGTPVAAQNQITTVSPNSAVQGTTGLLVTFTLDTDVPPAPPAGILPTSVTIGSLTGTSATHSSQYVVTAVFNIPAGETPGAKDCAVNFTTPNGSLTFSKTGGFTVALPPNSPPVITRHPQSQTVSVGAAVSFTVVASGTAPLDYQWQKDLENIGDADGASYIINSVSTGDAGSYRCVVTNDYGSAASDAAVLTVDTSVQVIQATYPVVDTMQSACYGASAAITCPSTGQSFHGQDSQFQGYQPRFTKSADGLTVYDNVTGLTWQDTPDTNANGTINSSDKLNWTQAQARPAALNAAHYGGFSDWRLPTIEELYSLMDFRGTDPSSYTGTDTSVLTPFIDRAYFDFAYGDTSAGERVIDSQYASSNVYVLNPSDSGYTKLFGVNFADGRIKGYDLTMPGGASKTFFVQCVRGNASYGLNNFVDNGEGTITDRATGLLWAQPDSGSAMNWEDALAWVQARNAAGYLGYSDWRMPNAKELQGILDYTRSPDTTGSAAIDPVFQVSSFTNEGGSATDYPWYWASTTHAAYGGGGDGVYVCFGRSLGWQQIGTNTCYALRDVHGAGAQRSDPKSGSPTSFYLGTACSGGSAYGHGPQGDVIRVTNYVRLVRGGAGPLRAGFTFSPSSPTDATPVTFTASASGATSPYAYAWDLGGTPASGASPIHSFAAGTHTVTLSVTDAAGLVSATTQDVTVGASSSAPPPVADGKVAGVAATFSRNATIPGRIDVTYDAGACVAQNAIILYGNLENFSTYQGCAQSNAGNSGTTSFDASALENVWFNIVWTNGTTAGHPGYGSSATVDVERSWNAAGLCGVMADDHGRDACP